VPATVALRCAAWDALSHTGGMAQPEERPRADEDATRSGRDAAAGDREAEAGQAPRVPTWEEVAEGYGDAIYTMAYRLTGNAEEAKDLSQDVFVRVLRSLHTYRPGTFEGWLYRITKNLFLDRMRRRRRVRFEPLAEEERPEPASAEPGPADLVDRATLEARLDRALAALPDHYRLAVVLSDVQGLSYEEIADTTGWPLGTVRSRIHRGRRRLRALLDEAQQAQGAEGTQGAQGTQGTRSVQARPAGDDHA